MTVNDLIDKISCYRRSDTCELTVRKYDEHQLCCNETVRIDSVSIGCDWQKDQIILHPEVKLYTSKEEIDKNLQKIAEAKSAEYSRLLSIMAKMALIIENMPESETKHSLKKILNKVNN